MHISKNKSFKNSKTKPQYILKLKVHRRNKDLVGVGAVLRELVYHITEKQFFLYEARNEYIK